MNSARLAAALATALLGLACSSPVQAPANLLGHGETGLTDLSPQGSLRYGLTFFSSGLYWSEWRMYGLYPGQDAADLSAYGREEGGFRAEGDRLAMNAQRLETWDLFYPADSRRQVQEPYPSGKAPFDGARFEILGDRLILHYTGVGAADEPVQATREYMAVR